MLCPHCGAESVNRNFCGACGRNLAEFSQLFAAKRTQPEELRSRKSKAQRLSLRLWTGAGIVFYIALYWIIISKVVVGKGHKLGGILFLVAVTVISVGGLLILYSAALTKRSASPVSDQRDAKHDTDFGNQTLELPTSVTEHTTEIPVNNPPIRGNENTTELPEKDVPAGVTEHTDELPAIDVKNGQ